MAYWYWLAFGMLLAGIEMFLPSFTALWFGVGALIVGALVWIHPTLSLTWQILIWAIASAGFTWLWFGYFKNRSPDLTTSGLAREAILGETAQVIRLPVEGKRGMIRFTTPKLGSDEWPFICEQAVAIGDRVIVADLSGNTLIVRKH